VKEGFRLAAELDLGGVGDVEAAAVVPDVGADVPRGAGRLNRWVAADDEDRGRGQGIAQRRSAVFRAGECLGEGDVVCSAMVVDVICAENGAGELL
jgi:hypothetical protein